MKKTLGGDRLGSGNKMQVNLHGFERSTHDLSYLWRSTMSPGTLVPFMSEIALPGDTFDINLACEMLTHPTIGPLFGSFKVQLDVFQAPIRLYNALLHNNQLGIGLNMKNVKLPQIRIQAPVTTSAIDIDNAHVNPSCLLAYFGIRGAGRTNVATTRDFNAVPILAYWEIYKNYYSNKMEEIGAVVHTPFTGLINTVTSITVGGITLPSSPTLGNVNATVGTQIVIAHSGTIPNVSQILAYTNKGMVSFSDLCNPFTTNGSTIVATLNYQRWGNINMFNWAYVQANDPQTNRPLVQTFQLSNIDTVRQQILASGSSQYLISASSLDPYKYICESSNSYPNALQSQEGLGLKTYQSDLFNNWLKTEYIDGPTGINQITAIDTSSGKFTLDTLNLSKKVYDMLNRIAVSGGTYDDWLDAVYTHDRYKRAESPIYCGGLIKELVFQEVVSNSLSIDQPLGTLAGRGVLSKKHKGGNIVIKVDEPSYIIGIISITPRLDYSQGNKWDTSLQTVDDLHKPNLDEIGFQELITEQMAFWDTLGSGAAPTTWIKKSAGKQPAWINYMTNVNVTRGNFAIQNNEMFMTLNRRYEPITGNSGIKDLTTYIDPAKYNFIFADTSIDAQNFWAQIAVDITARRKMSAKVMPNL